MILWLTAMNCYHAAQEKPEQFVGVLCPTAHPGYPRGAFR
jgi:hypothetical protein